MDQTEQERERERVVPGPVARRRAGPERAGPERAGPERAGPGAGAGREAGPWPRGQRHGPHADSSPADPGALALPPVAMPVLGLERRLVRRAEAVWEQLRPAGSLPPAAAIHAFETPLFAESAALFALPPHPLAPDCPHPRILRIGTRLGELGLVEPGPVAPDTAPAATVAARLAAMVARAVAEGAPVVVEIDTTAAGPRSGGADSRRGILLRAIALPFAPPPREAPAGHLAVVVASWRTLLSAEETADLQRELAAAMEWLRGTH
ncbi:hypothetical protein [Thermaurantiacus tibetensis]|uniref:hypothetical protein n=1 Tax=Thermaurantiacus tibetensis TaxID=2759035 RepID=UPI00188E6C8D|nr:hypothetical protein [Thermaurantiacus tibetensis]